MTFEFSAKFYDAIYVNKNYQKEFDYLRQSFEKSALEPFRFESVLEIGCGTGKFSKLLSIYSRKLVVTDTSPAMIEIAKTRLPQNTVIKESGIDELVNSDETYDLIIMLFHVFSYFDNDEIGGLKKLVEQNLKKEGYLIFDYWDYDGVRKKIPESTTKVFSLDGRVIERTTETKFERDLKNFYITVTYDSSDGSQMIEHHNMYAHKFLELLNNFPNMTLVAKLDLINQDTYNSDNYGCTLILKNSPVENIFEK